MFKLFIKKCWPTMIIVVAWAILTGLSEINLSISWIKNINIWANAVVLELFVYQVMSVVTLKLKSKYWQSLISLIVAICVGETIKYNFNNLDFSIINIIQICLLIFLFFYGGYYAFCHGIKKGIKETKASQAYLNQKVLQMNEKDYKLFIEELKRSIEYMKKHEFSAKMIKESSVEELEETIDEFDKIRNQNK